jgi:hypothetical protein
VLPALCNIELALFHQNLCQGCSSKASIRKTAKRSKNALLSIIEIFSLPLHLKNYQNFKGGMVNGHSTDNNTLRERIGAMPEDSILFRSEFPATRDNA